MLRFSRQAASAGSTLEIASATPGVVSRPVARPAPWRFSLWVLPCHHGLLAPQ